MKKLFFIAAMAIFAIGAATAQVYLPGEDTTIPCDNPGLDCATVVRQDTGYNVPFPNPCGPQQGDPGTVIDLTTREFSCF